MAWIPKMLGTPHIVNAETNDPLAMCIQAPGESLESGWSRACVMAIAPEMHHALADMIGHAKRHFPEELMVEVTKCEKLLGTVKELYDGR